MANDTQPGSRIEELLARQIELQAKQVKLLEDILRRLPGFTITPIRDAIDAVERGER